MQGMVLRMRLIMIWLIVTECIGGGEDLEKLGTGKIIIWVVLR